MSTNSLVNTANHTLESLAWSTFCEVIGAILNHIKHTCCPTHAACELSNKICLYLCRLGMCHTIYILVNWALRSRYCCSLDSLLKLLLCRLHKWRVECATYLQRQCTLCACCLKLLASNVDSINITTNNKLTRAVVVGSYNDVAICT